MDLSSGTLYAARWNQGMEKLTSRVETRRYAKDGDFDNNSSDIDGIANIDNIK